MRRLLFHLVLSVAAIGLMVGGCSQAAPAPAPTKAAAAPTSEPSKPAAPAKAPEPTKAAEPTKAPAAAPTAAPAKKVDYPSKGKAITMMVQSPAGGSSDLGVRILAPVLEKDLGVPIQVVNRSGANGQVAYTELARSTPDGYLVGLTAVPHIIGQYMDPSRQATFDRKSYQTLAMTITDPVAAAVTNESPMKSMKDLFDAAKANPGKVSIGLTGIGSTGDMVLFQLLQLPDLKDLRFRTVHMEGGAQVTTALLGGHVDAVFNVSSSLLPHSQSGKVRLIGMADTQESPFFPGVKTMGAQGYKAQMLSSHLLSTAAGLPREIVDLWTTNIKKALETDDVKKKITEMGVQPRYMTPEQAAAFWAETEVTIKPLMDFLAEKQKK